MKAIQILVFFLISLSVFAGNLTASPDGAEVYFLSPNDGDVIEGKVKVVMGLRNMGVAPAGIEKENTGHHHLIIDAAAPAAGESIGKDDNHRHFGGGQTEAEIELSTGVHHLQLVLGDFAHRPHQTPVVSEVITITVK